MCYRFLLPLLGVCLGLCSPLAAQDDTGWVLQRETDGIQVFTRSQGEGLIDDFKGVLVVTGNIDSAFRVLSDLHTFSKSDPVIVETKVIQVVNENEYYAWQYAKMPFFINDRDIVSKISLSRTAKGGYMMVSRSVPDFIPETPKLIRMQDVSLVVSLMPLDGNTFELQYKGHAGDAYGAIVTNVSNKAAVNSTFERLKQLRDLVAARPIADH